MGLNPHNVNPIHGFVTWVQPHAVGVGMICVSCGCSAAFSGIEIVRSFDLKFWAMFVILIFGLRLGDQLKMIAGIRHQMDDPANFNSKLMLMPG